MMAAKGRVMTNVVVLKGVMDERSGHRESNQLIGRGEEVHRHSRFRELCI